MEVFRVAAFHEETFGPSDQPRQLQVALLLHYCLPVAP